MSDYEDNLALFQDQLEPLLALVVSNEVNCYSVHSGSPTFCLARTSSQDVEDVGSFGRRSPFVALTAQTAEKFDSCCFGSIFASHFLNFCRLCLPKPLRLWRSLEALFYYLQTRICREKPRHFSESLSRVSCLQRILGFHICQT